MPMALSALFQAPIVTGAIRHALGEGVRHLILQAVAHLFLEGRPAAIVPHGAVGLRA